MRKPLSDLATAMDVRDVIESIAEGVVDRTRPNYQYGTVTDLVPDSALVQVLMDADAPIGGDPIPVRTGTVTPSQIGQRVRVAGREGDRYIDDVIGPAVFAGFSIPDGAETPAGAQARANKALADAKEYTDAQLLAVSGGADFACTPSGTSFLVTHNKGYKPAVFFWHTDGYEMEPEIEHLGPNSLMLTGPNAFSGTASLS